MATKLKNIKLTKIALCEQGANSEAHIQLFKNNQGGTQIMTFEELVKSLDEAQQKLITDEITKACGAAKEEMKKEMEDEVEDAKAKQKEAEDNLAKSQKEPEMTEEEMMKSLTPQMAEMYKSMKAQKEAAEAIAKKAFEDQLENEALAKSVAVKNVPGGEGEIKDLYKSLKQKDSKLAERVFDVLEKAHAIIEKSAAFEGKGAQGEGAPAGGNPDQVWAEIEKAAEPISKSKNISLAKATNVVIAEQPELYKKYLDAMRAE